MKEIKYPTLEQIDSLHLRIMNLTGGEQGYIGRSNLEFLLEEVRVVGNERNTPKAIVVKAAYLLHELVIEHPFVNGNKRTAFEVVKLFLKLNGYAIKAEPMDEYSFLVDIATGKVSRKKVEEWTETNLAEI